MTKPKYIYAWERPAPTLTTPALGEDGDRCDRTRENECRVDTLLRKYGEILPPNYHEDIDLTDFPDDPIDRMKYVKDLKDRLASRGLDPQGNIIDKALFDKAFPQSANPTVTVVDKVVDKVKEVTNEEQKANQ